MQKNLNSTHSQELETLAELIKDKKEPLPLTSAQLYVLRHLLI